jgi:hypothetical protein
MVASIRLYGLNHITEVIGGVNNVWLAAEIRLLLYCTITTPSKRQALKLYGR